MTKEMLEKRKEEMFKVCNARMKAPWKQAKEPFKVMENVYFVGTEWVSVFLIDTPEGLILVDCAYKEVFYQVIDSIYRLGFDPRNIKKLLLTHGHFDHCGAAMELQQISDCEIWIGKEDAYFFTERRDLIAFEDNVGPFRIDCFYNYGTPIEFGGMSILPVHCAGHTPGTTSLFFDVEHNGQVLTCGIHGGLGTNGLSKLELIENGWPFSRQQECLDNLNTMKEMKVDVVLPSHAGHTVDHNFFEIAKNDDGTGNGFIDSGAWKRMLESRVVMMQNLIEQERKEENNK